MKRLPSQIWAFFLVVGVISLLLAFGGEPVALLLRYERSAVGEGEWLRLIAGHWVHLSWSHALLNIVGLALVAALFHARAGWLAWWAAFGLSVAVIDAGFWLINEDLSWYVGLSGVLHGLFVFGALAEWRQGERTGLVLLIGAGVKLGFEQFVGAVPFTAAAAGGPVVVDAHLYGALGGALAYGLMRGLSGSLSR